MSHIRSKGNKSTELKLIALFRANQISGWRRNSKIFGNPDFVFPKYKLCVFVDDCFWHGCKCKKGRIHKTNKKYWKNKIERNKSQDKVVSRSLKNKGYSVIRSRECQLKKNPKRQLSRIINTIKMALFLEGLESEEHSKQNRDQNTNLPYGYALEGFDLGFEFHEFRL